MRRSAIVVFLLALSCHAFGDCVHFSKSWGIHGKEPGQFDLPIGIAINAKGEVYVTDHYNDRIQRFDAAGDLLGCYSSLPNPGGIGVDKSGQLYVTHFAATKPDFDKPAAVVCLAVYSADGKLLRQWGQQGAGDGEFNCPGGVAVAEDGRVFVADQTNHRVQVFDKDGKFLLKWGTYGTEPGQFGGGDSQAARTGGPQFVALDAKGDVWTTESMGCRVQKFSPQGEALLAWGDKEDAARHLGGFFAWPDGKKGRLQGPIGIAFDADGNPWLSACSGRVQCFDPAGKFICGLGEKQGDAPGEFNVPHGIAVRGNRLYVVDSLNHRIQQFER